jgi:hypothetical protein
MANQNDIFAEARLREEQLLKQLGVLPVVDVLGVVGPMGVSGGKIGREELWTLKLKMEAWRIHDTELQTRPLTIRRKVTNEDLSRLRGLIRPYNIIRIRARVVDVSSFGGPEALLEEFVGSDDSDTELNDHVIQLQRPVKHEDPLLGTFTLDRRVNWFEGSAVWNGNPVSLNLSVKEPAKIQEALTTAHSLWECQSVWNRRVRNYAVQALLALKNKSWLAEDEMDLTAEQFEQRMALESITVYPDGSFEFWHDDGKMFWGHSIQISGSLSEGPTDADIPG